MKPPHLFAYFGIELEYMVVDAATLAVRPWADRVLLDAQGRPTSDVDRGRLTWSNELIAHVVELKTTRPEESLEGLAADFAAEAAEVNRRLAPHGACLLPTAMHPFMRPEEAVLWPHEYSEVYATFDRIFDCRGHGWSNLQSVHLNLPFAHDEEFARLHAAIRLILPLLPALAASSPLVEGHFTGWADNRLAYYRNNSRQLPTLCGRVIPEPVFSEADYRQTIYAPIAEELARHDPAGRLEAEFSNSRGAIARFDRSSIEIRVLDLQESPAADLAMVRTIVAWLQELVAEKRLSLAEQQAIEVEPLRRIFDATTEQGGAALIRDPLLLRASGVRAAEISAWDLWRAVIDRLQPTQNASAAEQRALATFYESGSLADRLRAAYDSGEPVMSIYRRLAEGLCPNVPFEAPAVRRHGKAP